MTATLHRGLEPSETLALRSLGVPLDNPNLTIDISWGLEWRDTELVDGGTPIVWEAEYWVNETTPTGFGRRQLEHGPDEHHEPARYSDGGTLATIGAEITRILNTPGLDENTGVDLHVNGWALHITGALA